MVRSMADALTVPASCHWDPLFNGQWKAISDSPAVAFAIQLPTNSGWDNTVVLLLATLGDYGPKRFSIAMALVKSVTNSHGVERRRKAYCKRSPAGG